MELRSLKKEVDVLDALVPLVQNFQRSWLLPLRKGTQRHPALLYVLPVEQENQARKELAQAQTALKQLHQADAIRERLRMHARHLIELKLAALRQDRERISQVAQQLATDDYFSLRKTIQDIRAAKKDFRTVAASYAKIHALLSRHLPLEERLHFLDLPHRRELSLLKQHLSKKEKLCTALGNQFVLFMKSANKTTRPELQW
ncbi:MAG: hypothetical protein Q8R53_03525 [Nanoarchaeota archaeon]|nr:hypothetical protein [Nanoarchaeota archaeon]